MKGRKPKPHSLKLIQGNPGKRRLGKPAPEPSSAGRIYCPKWISVDRYARETWAAMAPELRKMGLLSKIDVPQFSLFCLAQSEVRHAIDDLRNADSRQYETHGKGGRMYRTSPAYGRLIEAVRLQASLGSAFGLNPVDRRRVDGLPLAGRADNPFARHGSKPRDP